MKKYRLGYNYFFLAENEFSYKGEKIAGLSIDVLFKVYDKNGNEILQDDEKDHEIFTLDGREIYACNLLSCAVSSKEELFEFIPCHELLRHSSSFIGSCSFAITGYTKDKIEPLENEELEKLLSDTLGDNLPNEFKRVFVPTNISEEEFKDIFRNNFEMFDTTTNKSAQVSSYFSQEKGSD